MKATNSSLTLSNELSGRTHVFELACDLWPVLEYSVPTEYKSLHVHVEKHANHSIQLEAVKLSLREKLRRFTPLTNSDSRRLAMGDGAIVSLEAFLTDQHGHKTRKFSDVQTNDTSGRGVKIVMETGRHMQGLVEGLVGCVEGEQRTIRVVFPVRKSGPGVSLSGMFLSAIVEFNTVSSIMC
jgi:FKBP-type peptidyl-prolyl cis-trans isomerase (trigger factor)